MYNSRKEWHSKKYLEYQDWIDTKLVYIKKSEKSESGTPTIPFFSSKKGIVKNSFKRIFYFIKWINIRNIYSFLKLKKFIIMNFLTLESSVISTELWLSMGVGETHILFNP